MPLVLIAVLVGAVLARARGRRPAAAPPSASRRRPGDDRPDISASSSLARRSSDRIDTALLAGGAVLSPVGLWVTAGTASAVAAGAGYALLAGYSWRHRTHPGMAMVLAGLVSNLTVIVVNRGMPVRGVSPGISTGLHHGMTAADHLTGLADVISLPVLAMTVSPGDLVLSLGGAIAAFFWLARPSAASGRHPGRVKAT